MCCSRIGKSLGEKVSRHAPKQGLGASWRFFSKFTTNNSVLFILESPGIIKYSLGNINKTKAFQTLCWGKIEPQQECGMDTTVHWSVTLNLKKFSDLLIGSCLNLLWLARYDNFGFKCCAKLNPWNNHCAHVLCLSITCFYCTFQ